MQVNKERLTLFLDALRSGDYVQGKSRLATWNVETSEWNYCCLGVACEVAAAHGLDIEIVEKRTTDVDDYYGHKLYGGYKLLMPGNVAYWYGLAEIPSSGEFSPELQWGDGTESASHLNDNAGLSFTEIAELFEATFMPGGPNGR